MKKILYWQANAGISGDMTVASLLALGADFNNLQQKLAGLQLLAGKFDIELKAVNKAGFAASKFDVICHAEQVPAPEFKGELAAQKAKALNTDAKQLAAHMAVHTHAHPHEHVHENEHVHEHSHDHGDEHVHSHEHVHTHEHAHSHEHKHSHVHEHHAYAYVKSVIQNSALTEKEKALALAVFAEIAAVEAQAHGISVEEVHFHEVGAIDSIVDVVAAVVCLQDLAPDAVIISPLAEGYGQVKCAHGNINVPVPAVSAILERHKLQVQFIDEEGEHITPTGAAIAAILASQSKLPAHYRLLKTAYGAGTKDFPNPNLLVARLLEVEDAEFDTLLVEQSVETTPQQTAATLSTQEYLHDEVYRVDCNLDNITGENFAFLLEELFNAAALDVWYTPIFMKKNRPAYQLSLLCCAADLDKFSAIIFKHSKTLGLRYSKWQRNMLEREILKYEVDLEFNEAAKQAAEDSDFLALQAKIAYLDGKEDLRPEYEAVANFARKLQIPYAEAYAAVLDLAKEFNAMFDDDEEE